MRTYRAQKAALTRAKNTGDPNKVIAEVRKTEREWDKSGPWPDDWRRWRQAESDAQWALERGSY